MAEYDSAITAWVFHTARSGDIVMDVAAGYEKRWSGSAWVRNSGANKLIRHEKAKCAAAFAALTGWTTVMSSTSWSAAVTTNKIAAFGTVCAVTTNAAGVNTFNVGLFVDSEVSPRASIDVVVPGIINYALVCPLEWLEFNPTDLSAHTIHVKAKIFAGGGTTTVSVLEHSSCKIVEMEP